MPVPCSVVAESTGPGVVSTHLAERAQNKEDDQPANKISEQDGGPGKFYGFGGSIKQPCADSAAEGDQLDMAVFQIFAQPVLRVYTVMRTYCIRTLCLRTAFCTRTFRTGSILHKNGLSVASGLVLPYPVLPLGSGKGGTLFYDVDGCLPRMLRIRYLSLSTRWNPVRYLDCHPAPGCRPAPAAAARPAHGLPVPWR